MPVGTVITDAQTGEALIDLNHNGMKFVIAKGGRGGFGNQHYVNSVRQAPNFAEKGEPGERRRVLLKTQASCRRRTNRAAERGQEHTYLAYQRGKAENCRLSLHDVGAKPWRRLLRDTSFVVADMPGLIEGAHAGVGLGHQFLRHVERSRVLVHVVDGFPIDETDPLATHELIEKELKLYSEEIWQRPRIIALNKIDLLPAEAVQELKAKFRAVQKPVFAHITRLRQGPSSSLRVVLAPTRRWSRKMLYKCTGMASSNQPGATGEGMLLAEQVGAELIHMDQVQIHPSLGANTNILVTEASRGAGAIMVNREAKRFVDELTTRDLASAAILEQTGKTDVPLPHGHRMEPLVGRATALTRT